MAYLLNNKNIIEENVKIKDIPCIILRPVNDKGLIPTIILYHGWGSSKESQRFRAFILSSTGYQVIIPDSIYHGDRSPIDHRDGNNMIKYFWEVIMKNIDESNYIIEEAINKYKADPDNMIVMGHSMGGFTSSGIFTHNEKIKTTVILNGSFNWQMSNEIFAEAIGENIALKQEEEIKRLDPMNNLDKLLDRPALILHAGSDEMVSINPQKVFYERVRPLYKDESKIDLIEYLGLGHFVTTNMMEDGVKWLEKHCKMKGD